MQAHPYLTFNGDCREAFEFYERTLNAAIVFMMPHTGSPAEGMGGPEWGDKILHASLKIGDTLVFGSDQPPAYYARPSGMSVSLDIPDVAEADRVYAALIECGQIKMAIQETFWALRFAMVTDRFGTPWMINCEKPMA